MSKTVYLLGAGASAASEYALPTMKNLISEELFRRYNQLTAFIERFYPNQKFEEIDIEELISFIDLADNNFSIFGEYPDPGLWHVKNELSICLRERLKQDPARPYCNKYKQLFRNHADAKCTDTIISLNYDLVIDKTLAALSTRRENQDLSKNSIMSRMYRLVQETVFMGGIPFSCSPDPAYFLKLHGSLDWYYCSNSDCRFHQIFFVNRLEPWPETTDNSLCQLCGSRAAPVMVPPNINKSLQKFPKLSFIWNMAYRELRAADTWSIIGLSFREADYYLKGLLHSAVRNASNSTRRIEVVDPDDRVRQKIQKITGIEPRYFKSLDDFIQYKAKKN